MLILVPLLDGQYSLVETTVHRLSPEMASALVAIAGVLNPGCTPGWVQYRLGLPDLDGVLDTGSRSVRLHVVYDLVNVGLMEQNDEAYRLTYRITPKGREVVALIRGGAL